MILRRRALLKASAGLVLGLAIRPVRAKLLRGGAAVQITSGPIIYGATINGTPQAPALLSVLVAATPNNGTLFIPAGHWYGTSGIDSSSVTINGVGMGQTIIDCTGFTPTESKAILVPRASGAIISNLTLQNAAIAAPDGNAAGIKDNGFAFTATNVEVTQCQDGILTTSGPGYSDSFTGCNIHGNGNGNPGNGNTHEMYLGGDTSNTMTLLNTSATCGSLATHALKSRAGTTNVTGGTFTGNGDDGTNGGAVINIPDRGNVTLNGTTLVTKGVDNHLFYQFGSETSTNPGTTVSFTNAALQDNTGSGGIILSAVGGTLNITTSTYAGPTPPTITGWSTVNGAFTPA